MNLKKKDRILFINNKKIHNSSSFRNNLQRVIKNSESFQVTVLRGHQKLSLNYQSSSLGKGNYKVKLQKQKAQRQIASVLPKSSTPLEKNQHKTKTQSKTRQNTSTQNSSIASSSNKSSSQKTSSNKPSSQKTSSQKTSSQKPSSNKPSSQKPSSQKTSSNKPSSQKSKKPSQTKNLIPEKLKDQFQRAYINRSNSFVYSKPDFDSSRLRPLSIGKLVLISRKIYLPPHSFGSFYRIFLFRPKKLIGYISEAEVIPEFKLNQGVYTINPNYKKAKRYKDSRQTLKIQNLENNVTSKQRSKIQEEMKKRIDSHHQTSYKNYYGVFIGSSSYLNNIDPSQSQHRPLLGFNFSSYRTKVNFDINLGMYLKNVFFIEKGSFDFLIGLPFIKTSSYSLLTSIGMFVEYQPTITNTVNFDLGPIVSTSFLVPLNKNFLLNLSAKGNYQSIEGLFSLKLLAGLQFSF